MHNSNSNNAASVYKNQLKRPQPVVFGKQQKVRVVNPSQVKHVATERRTATKNRAQSISSNAVGNLVSKVDFLQGDTNQKYK